MACTFKGVFQTVIIIYSCTISFISQVFRVAYCQIFSLSRRDECQRVCEEFVSSIKEHFPHLQKKVKIHLLLHLTDNMVDFGPTSSFNTERYSVYITIVSSFLDVKHSTP